MYTLIIFFLGMLLGGIGVYFATRNRWTVCKSHGIYELFCHHPWSIRFRKNNYIKETRQHPKR